MKYQLRPYQESAVSAAANWIKYRSGANGFISAPGGSGKSLMIARTAEFAHKMQKRVVVLARNEKLLTQNQEKFTDKSITGLYCAGLESWDVSKPITIASIQSIARLENPPKFDLAIVDECQNISPDSEEETQYWNFLKVCGNPQIIGFTATPFRTKSGKISWGEEIIEIPIKNLFDAGYIVPPTNKATLSPNTDKVQIAMGEFAQKQLEELFIEPELLYQSVEKIAEYGENRNSAIIFCQSIKHCELLADVMQTNKMPCVVVSGDTPKPELNNVLEAFKRGEFKYLINCQLLTEGYDIPCLDMVVILRSTISKGLFEQAAFRGTRPHPGKKDFLLLDMGGNLERHGPIGSPYREKGAREQRAKLYKACPECEDVTPINSKECVNCGYIFLTGDPKKVDHDSAPDTKSATVYDSNLDPVMKWYNVSAVVYRKHVKAATKAVSLRVDYHSPEAPYGAISEWLSPYSESDWAKQKCWDFFRERGKKLPSPVESYPIEDLIWHAEFLKKPVRIEVDHKDQYPRIKKYEYASGTPDTNPVHSLAEGLDDEIPF